MVKKNRTPSIFFRDRDSCDTVHEVKARECKVIDKVHSLPMRKPKRRDIYMAPSLKRGLFSFTLVVLVMAGSAAAPGQESFGVLLAVGDMRGEIKPCGCSEKGQMGGLLRRLTYLESLMSGGENTPVLVDLGNNFPPPSDQGRIKVELIQPLLKRFPPHAYLPGPNEWAMGFRLMDPDLPYVLSNARSESPWPEYRTVERGGRRLGLYGYLSPEEVFQGRGSPVMLEAASAVVLERMVHHMAREHHVLRVLLFRGSDAELELFAASGRFELIVAGNPSPDELTQITERRIPAGLVPQVPTKSQGVLRMNLPSKSVPRPPVAVDWLTEAYADHPEAVKAMQAYDEKVKQMFFSRLSTVQKAERESLFAGEATCRQCHPAAAAVWNPTRHAHALATLERVGKNHDPECLACHVVGYEQGGYLSQGLTPTLANVQCENCHGPSRGHAALPTVRTGQPPGASLAAPTPPTEGTCRQCHKGSHSPVFDFSVYWPKIKHGK